MDDEILKQIQKEQKENKKKEEKQKKHKQNVKSLHQMFPNFTKEEIISVYLHKHKNFDKCLDALLNPNIFKEIEEEQKNQIKEEEIKQEKLEKEKQQEEKRKQDQITFDKQMDDLFKEDLLVSKIASLLPGYTYEKIRGVLRVENGELEKTIKVLVTPLQKQEIKKTDISEIKLEKDENKENLEEMLKIDEYFQKITIFEESDEEDDSDEEEVIEELDILSNLDFEKVIDFEKEKEKKIADVLTDPENNATQDLIMQVLETDLSKYDENMELIETKPEKDVIKNEVEYSDKISDVEYRNLSNEGIISKAEILHDLQKRFTNSKNDWRFELVIKKDLFRNFQIAYKKLNCKPIIGYHGTPPKNISSIVQKGLSVPGSKGFEHATDTGYYGRGIYLSPDAGMSITYCRGGGSLIVCAVLMGKAYQCEGLMMGAPVKKGYNSHISPRGDELVLFNANQVLPLYVIHFSPNQLVKKLFGTHYFVEKGDKETKKKLVDKKEKFTKKLKKYSKKYKK